MTTRLTAAAVAIAVAAGSAAAFDIEAAQRRIDRLTIVYGRIAALAPACELRDDDWVEALELQVLEDALAPDIESAGEEIARLENRYTNQQMEAVKRLALAALALEGAAKLCPPLKRDPALARADGLVKKWRTPKSWSGAGGIK